MLLLLKIKMVMSSLVILRDVLVGCVMLKLIQTVFAIHLESLKACKLMLDIILKASLKLLQQGRQKQMMTVHQSQQIQHHRSQHSRHHQTQQILIIGNILRDIGQVGMMMIVVWMGNQK